MGREILSTLSLAGTLVFAIPAAIAGVELFLAGREVLGGALLATAAGMVIVVEVLPQPQTLVKRALGRRVVDATSRVTDSNASVVSDDSPVSDEQTIAVESDSPADSVGWNDSADGDDPHTSAESADTPVESAEMNEEEL